MPSDTWTRAEEVPVSEPVHPYHPGQPPFAGQQHPGQPYPAPAGGQRPIKKGPNPWLFFTVFFAAAFAILASIGAIVSDGDPSPRDQDDAAIAYCEDQVLASLKAPATASFTGTYVTALDNGHRVVRGSVDSENGFGALIRSGFKCTVEPDGDTWNLIRIDFDD
jgi:hypothetical protein